MEILVSMKTASSFVILNCIEKGVLILAKLPQMQVPV